MESEAQLLLDDAIAFCREAGSSERLLNMLAQSKALDLTEDTLTIEAPTRFAYSYLEKHRGEIEPKLEEIAFAPIALSITVPVQQPAAQLDRQPPMAGAAPSAADQRKEDREAPNPYEEEAARYAAELKANRPMMGSAADEMGAVSGACNRAADAPDPQLQSMTATPPSMTPPAMTPPIAVEKNPSSVTVTNTLSPDAFKRMMSEMKGSTASAMRTQKPLAEPKRTMQPQGAIEEYPSMPTSSKFTFATFVYGDENKHAYHSAQRFAAFADEPGQYNSLFIYGGSGLGKTHLLLAIKNYLAEKKPDIKVKYANSQAYIDDFINEIARQKTEGRAILREYHEANVLIIDDIQNIIGKQASIEYFFSLMDEFIRENKKIVIASDRAPKKLGMDERLTSRFNAGMLCLVSEPSFEMKYTILKRYYESIIEDSGDFSNLNIDTSLLGAFQAHEGKLTDEQLRHMAEISGNNIRELESFCERCASLSSEREQAGQELSADDIEKVANEYFDTARKVIHIDTIQRVVEDYYNVSHEMLIGPRRKKDIAFARHVAIYLANDMCDGLSSSAIGEEFGGRDHSTILNSLKKIESAMKEDRRICEELQQLRNKIMLKS